MFPIMPQEIMKFTHGLGRCVVCAYVSFVIIQYHLNSRVTMSGCPRFVHATDNVLFL
jgi:hypothetical protein